jgi:tRNA G18 (ribose-2'-O)-methylase SpoU
VLQACDDFVHIPMAGFKNSINVANAFAIIAFHIASSVSDIPAEN